MINHELGGTRPLDGFAGIPDTPAANEGQMESDRRITYRVRDTSELFEQQSILLRNYETVLAIYSDLKTLAEQHEKGEISEADVVEDLRSLAEKFQMIWPLNEGVVRNPKNASAPSADIFEEFERYLKPENRHKLEWNISRFSTYIKETRRNLRLEEDRLSGIQRESEQFRGPEDGNVTERVDGPVQVAQSSKPTSSDIS